MNGYHLLVKFSDTVIPLTNAVLKELTIVQDLNRFLPSFRFVFEDNTGLITHLSPADKRVNSLSVELAENANSPKKNIFDFSVYERTPKGESILPSNTYDIVGLLDINNLFSPDHSRGWNQSIKSTLETIAGELVVDSTEISDCLSTTKNIIQPQWSNAEVLRYLKKNLIGSANESNFKCFIKVHNGKTIFVFKSTEELIKAPIKYKFILHDQQYQDLLPILNYKMYDSFKLINVFASRKQSYGYYDYTTGSWVTGDETTSGLTSISDFFLMEKDSQEQNNSLIDNGTNNAFTSDYKGKVRASYHDRLLSLSKMWITTRGLPNAVPGDTIQIFFPQGIASAGLYSYQYNGYWLVEKVVHNIGDAFLTKLLLTRNGIDSDVTNSLLKATEKKLQ